MPPTRHRPLSKSYLWTILRLTEYRASRIFFPERNVHEKVAGGDYGIRRHRLPSLRGAGPDSGILFLAFREMTVHWDGSSGVVGEEEQGAGVSLTG